MTSKRHHLVPEFYLEFFTDRSGSRPVVWVYDKERPGARPQLPKDTTVETHFHTFERVDGTRTDQLERELAKMESIAKPILQRWQRREARPADGEIAEMAYFLGVMHCRVRRIVEGIREWMGEFGRWLLQRAARDPGSLREFYEYAAQNEPELRLPPIDDLREVLKDPGRHFLITGNEKPALGLSLTTMPKEVAGQLLTMNWCICRAPTDALFVTSDTPLNIFLQEGPLASFGTGLGLPQVEVAFPISPTVCVYIDRRHAEARRRVSSKFVWRINRRIAFAAEQFVIASVKSKRLEALVRQAAVSRTWPKWNRDALRKSLEDRFPNGSSGSGSPEKAGRRP